MLWFLAHNFTVLICLMSISASISTDNQICLLVYLRIERVEVLAEIVVKCTWLTIMLHPDRENSSDIFGWHESPFDIHVSSWIQTRMIVHFFFGCLSCIFLYFQGKVVFWFIPLLITPISTGVFSLCLSFFLSTTEKMISPWCSPTQVVPISDSIKWNRNASTPEDPSALSNHPYVGLTHVIRNMEHHC